MDSEILIYQTPDGNTKVDVKVENETVWLNQNQTAELFQTTQQNISLHIKNIYDEGELPVNTTVKDYLTVQTEGKRQVNRNVQHYNLDVIISVGYRVKSHIRTVSHKQAEQYVLQEFEKYNKQLEESTVDELDRAIKKIAPFKKKNDE